MQEQETEEIRILLNQLMIKVDHLTQFIKSMDTPASFDWLPEERVMYLLSLTKKTLARFRAEGKFRTSSATGKKIKYYRPDIEAYLYNDTGIRKPIKRSVKKS